jgi:hypothetical protein
MLPRRYAGRAQGLNIPAEPIAQTGNSRGQGIAHGSSLSDEFGRLASWSEGPQLNFHALTPGFQYHPEIHEYHLRALSDAGEHEAERE